MSRSNEARELMASVQKMTAAELADVYGITINAHGEVHDQVEGVTFPSLDAWIDGQLADSYEHFHHHGYDND